MPLFLALSPFAITLMSLSFFCRLKKHEEDTLVEVEGEVVGGKKSVCTVYIFLLFSHFAIILSLKLFCFEEPCRRYFGRGCWCERESLYSIYVYLFIILSLCYNFTLFISETLLFSLGRRTM